MTTTIATMKDPCLTLVSDDNSKEIFHINKIGQPDWNKLKQSPLLRHVHVHQRNQKDESELFFDMAIAVKLHHRIAKITFDLCTLIDLVPLFVALAGHENDHGPQLLKLQFLNSKLDARATETLRLILASNLVGAISFYNCNIDEKTVQTSIAAGLGKNQTLQIFGFCGVAPLQLMRSTQQMVTNNRNLVQLSLTLNKDNHFWELFRAVEAQKSLQRLKVVNSTVILASMEALMLMCHVVESLKILGFVRCILDRDALEFMVRTLSSNNHVLETLVLCRNHVEMSDTHSLTTNFGTMQVNRLVLTDAVCSNWDLDTLPQVVDSWASNSWIKSLDLGCLTDMERELLLPKVCNDLLQQNHHGLQEFIVDDVFEHATVLTDALQHNTNLKILSVNRMESTDLVLFAQGLARMQGLRKLVVKDLCQYSKEFFQVLQQSLEEENTTLWTLCLDGIESNDERAKPYLPQIRYLLAINRVGRRRLLTAATDVPSSLWPNVLARSSKEPDGIYYILTGKPHLCAPPSRKRKCDVSGL